MNMSRLIESKLHFRSVLLFLKQKWQAGQGGTHLAILLVGEHPQSPLNTQ